MTVPHSGEIRYLWETFAALGMVVAPGTVCSVCSVGSACRERACAAHALQVRVRVRAKLSSSTSSCRPHLPIHHTCVAPLPPCYPVTQGVSPYPTLFDRSCYIVNSLRAVIYDSHSLCHSIAPAAPAVFTLSSPSNRRPTHRRPPHRRPPLRRPPHRHQPHRCPPNHWTTIRICDGRWP